MLKVNLGVRAGEQVLVLSDQPQGEDWRRYSPMELEEMVETLLLARAVYDIGREHLSEADFSLTVYPATGSHGAEPPNEVAEAMKGADVVVALTHFSLTHTDARVEACRRGARVASMPGFRKEMFYPDGSMASDYREVKRRCEAMAQALEGKGEVEVTTAAGTQVSFSIKGRKVLVDHGFLTEPGSYGNLPAGEVYTAPVEGTGQGRIVVEAGWWPGLEEDMVLTLERGLVVGVEGGGAVGRDLEARLFEEGHEDRRNLAELGVGTNPKAHRLDSVLESEKILGTVHLAIGDNAHIGGTVTSDLHIDFVLPKPTLKVEGEPLIRGGEWLI
jgi:leucyl aminopeptidase (aminopeptidase T)